LIEHVTFTSIVRGFKVDVLAGQLFGGTIGELDVSVTLVVGAVLVLVLAATMLLHDLPRHATGRPLLFVLAIAYSTAFYVGEAHVGGVHARYAVLPGLLLLAALAVGVDAALSSHPLRYAFVPALAALAVGLACARGFSAGSFRTDGPTWSTSVDAARSTCAATRQRTIVVAILPANGEWSVTVPCERLR
jgi:hypothetical protein